MVCIVKYDEVYAKKQRLQALLKDITESRETYNGTRLIDIVEAQSHISNANPDEVTVGDKIDYLDLLYDYCIGKIIEQESNSEEQMTYYRIIEECLDAIERLADEKVKAFFKDVIEKKKEE